MSEQKFRINIIDFLPFHGRLEAGKDKNGEIVYYGDTVKYNNSNHFVAYRYGSNFLKQVGIWAMIGSARYDKGDFYNCEKQNIIAAGDDWLIIGYNNEPVYDKLKEVLPTEIIQQ